MFHRFGSKGAGRRASSQISSTRELRDKSRTHLEELHSVVPALQRERALAVAAARRRCGIYCMIVVFVVLRYADDATTDTAAAAPRVGVGRSGAASAELARSCGNMPMSGDSDRN